MKKTFAFVMFTAAVGLLTGCGGGAANVNSNAETTAKIEKAVAAAPTRGLLVGLETKAFEAWKNNDAAFWDGYLDPSFVAYVDGKRYDKAGEIKLITDGKCEIASFAFSDEKMTPIGNDAIALTTKVIADGKCGGVQIPSPVISTSLYVRSGDGWKAAYHNEVPILDPKAPKTVSKTIAAKPTPPEKSDVFTEELFAIEKKSWDAWKAGDRAALEPLVTDDVTLVEMTGVVVTGKKAVIDSWTEPKCNIKTAVPTDGMASQPSPVVGILTYKGTATGTCEGQPLADAWVTSIYLKEGGEWKIIYIFESPI